MKKKRYFSRTVCFLLCAVFALLFLLPTVLTITNSFMTQSEITASYGQVFENANDGKSYISKTIELKFIPDKVSFTQYFTVLLKSPDYLLKFWNSVILTAPIVFAQLMVASIGLWLYPLAREGARQSVLLLCDPDAHAVSGHAGPQLSGERLAEDPQYPVGDLPARRVCAVLGLSAHQIHAPHPHGRH